MFSKYKVGFVCWILHVIYSLTTSYGWVYVDRNISYVKHVEVITPWINVVYIDE